MTASELAQDRERLQQANTLLNLALHDAIDARYDAVLKVKGKTQERDDVGIERFTFKLSRAKAAHGGLLTIIWKIPDQSADVYVRYAEQVFNNPREWPSFTWPVIDQLRAIRNRLLAGDELAS